MAGGSSLVPIVANSSWAPLGAQRIIGLKGTWVTQV
jgi:hypothetical protein